MVWLVRPARPVVSEGVRSAPSVHRERHPARRVVSRRVRRAVRVDGRRHPAQQVVHIRRPPPQPVNRDNPLIASVINRRLERVVRIRRLNQVSPRIIRVARCAPQSVRGCHLMPRRVVRHRVRGPVRLNRRHQPVQTVIHVTRHILHHARGRRPLHALDRPVPVRVVGITGHAQRVPVGITIVHSSGCRQTDLGRSQSVNFERSLPGESKFTVSTQRGERCCSQAGWQLASQPGGVTRSAKHLGPLRSRACAELCVRVDAGLYTAHCAARCAATDGMIAGRFPGHCPDAARRVARQWTGCLPGHAAVSAADIRRITGGFPVDAKAVARARGKASTSRLPVSTDKFSNLVKSPTQSRNHLAK